MRSRLSSQEKFIINHIDIQNIFSVSQNQAETGDGISKDWSLLALRMIKWGSQMYFGISSFVLLEMLTRISIKGLGEFIWSKKSWNLLSLDFCNLIILTVKK